MRDIFMRWEHDINMGLVMYIKKPTTKHISISIESISCQAYLASRNHQKSMFIIYITESCGMMISKHTETVVTSINQLTFSRSYKVHAWFKFIH